MIGGAGGVGSMAIQLLKKLTPAKVIATASRNVSQEWCKKLGADFVIDHLNLKEELLKIGFKEVDFIFSTNQTENYHSLFNEIVRPFGHVTLIDDPKSFDIKPFKAKAINVNFEFMFARSMFNYDLQAQGDLLNHVASMIDKGEIKTTLNRELIGFQLQNIKDAHSILESQTSVGKIVMSY